MLCGVCDSLLIRLCLNVFGCELWVGCRLLFVVVRLDVLCKLYFCELLVYCWWKEIVVCWLFVFGWCCDVVVV